MYELVWGHLVSEISSLSLDEIRRSISESNRRSAESKSKYVLGESRALQSEYEFVTCPCRDDCWCKRNACDGHYRLKEVTFESFLETYLNLWIPPSSRGNLQRAVLIGAPFTQRQRNAIKPLQWLRVNWRSILQKVRCYDKCGLCDSALPPTVANVSDLYQAKMWSQLFYDSLVPFDTKSRTKIIRAGYPDPKRDFLAMNKALFHDLRKLSDVHCLGVTGIRRLDSPWMVNRLLPEPAGGQPLSRVVDKIFYRP